ncbi:heat shock 70 kDa protein [Medicago truncatula]|uniref:Heat shock 70 kDa protein n=1 Tax=Medicago truncatula TaxID=3880 RepID=G7ILL7_MEDTR|nr:heat shock 70 kDa protein [Medicago truncatula]
MYGGGVKTDDNFLLGKFELYGFSSTPRKVPNINVCFDVDAVLEATAKDKKKKKRLENMTITNKD